MAVRDEDADSIASFQSSPSPTKPSSKLQTWTGNQQAGLGCLLQHIRRSSTFACCMRWIGTAAVLLQITHNPQLLLLCTDRP
jgi:hypothetical protein